MNIDHKLGFIIGHYKSGSTWLAHLLSLYPGIRGVRETHIFRYAKEHKTLQGATAELFTEAAWAAGGIEKFPRYWLANTTRAIRVQLGLASGTASLNTTDVPTSLHDLGLIKQFQLKSELNNTSDRDEYLKVFFNSLVKNLKPEHYLMEKTPTNIFFTEDIKRVFPKSKLISIHRDGRDVVLSDLHHLRRTNRQAQNFEQRVLKWKNAIEADLDKAEKYDVFLLSYEELKEKPVELTKSILDYLELHHDEKLINSMIKRSSFEAMSGGRKAGKEDSSNFFRKGIVGDWQNQFTEEEIKLFSELAGDLLVRLGYENSPNYKEWK